MKPFPKKLTTFPFKAKLWIYPGEAAWHFVTLPKKEAQVINERFEEHKRGFGSLKVEITVGETTWQTSIFPDKSSGSYVLPIKALVRKKEQLSEGQSVSIQLRVLT